MKLMAMIEDPVVIAKILDHLGFSSEVFHSFDIFEQTWTLLDWKQASFVTHDVDLDLVYDTTLPQIEEAESWGRFYQLMGDMFFTLQDAHTYFDSESE